MVLPRLRFNDKLSSVGGTDALLKKLKALHTELAAFDQGAVDVASLSTVRKQLIANTLLLHKDRGVKAFTACCLADILRLYAPDAPYTQNELRDIFQFFFRQLSNGLKGTDAPYYTEYFHLLESLSTVKSVVLVCDLPSADDLLVDVFRDFFNLVKRDLPKKVEFFMADILVALIDEAQAVPQEALQILLDQYSEKETPAFRMSVQICNQTADKLQRHVCQYFTDIIVSHSKGEDEDENDFEDIKKAHRLVKRLHRSSPGLLHSVIPQLEEELRVEEVQLRVIAVGVLGDMYGDKGGADLIKKHPSTWTLWLGRRNDKSAVVRLRMVESMKGLIVGLPDQRDAIEESLASKLLDPDEKVRAAVCKVYAQLDYESALHHVSAKQLKAVAERGADKKHTVRVESLTCLGKLYSLAYPEIEIGDPAAIAQFSWIPQEILHLVTVSTQVRTIVEQVLSEYILPLTSPTPSPSSSKTAASEVDEGAWTDRLLTIMGYLDDKAIKALLNLTGLKNIRPHLCDHFLESCVKYNGGVMDENEDAITRKLKAVIQHLSQSFPEPHKASDDLHAFAKLNEQRLYKLLKACMDAQTDLKGLIKATNEFTKRVDQASSSISGTMQILLRRASLRIVNQSSIPTLIKRLSSSSSSSALASQPSQSSFSQSQYTSMYTPPLSSSATNAATLLRFISKHQPALYQSHIGELTKAIAFDEQRNRNGGKEVVELAVQALSSVVRAKSELGPNDKRTLERISKLALESDCRRAKFAARFFAFSSNKEQGCLDLVETIADRLATAEPDTLAAHVAVLIQMARFAPEAFEAKSDVIMGFLIKKVLMVPGKVKVQPSDSMETEPEWLEDADVPPQVRAKILALKVCRHRSLYHAKSDVEVTKPVLSLFGTLLDHQGSISATKPEDPRVASRLRLQAGVSLLHLCTVDTFRIATGSKFVRLATMAQDNVWAVRYRFLTKLIALLSGRKLAPQFNIIPFLTVNDADPDTKVMASSFIAQAFRSMPTMLKVEHFEMQFIRLLHLLAHHPEYSEDLEGLIHISQYIAFYLDHIANPDTVSLLLHLALKCKTVRDAHSDDSRSLYVVAELAQTLIRNRAALKEWALPSYPGKVRLPSDILRPLPDASVISQTLKTVYLSDEMSEWLESNKKPAVVKEKRERKPTIKRKASSAPKANGSAKRARARRRKRRDDDDDDEDDGDDSDSQAGTSEHMSTEPPEATADEEDEESDGEEKLGRGARTRAKRKLLRQQKKMAMDVDKPESPADSALTDLSDDE